MHVKSKRVASRSAASSRPAIRNLTQSRATRQKPRPLTSQATLTKVEADGGQHSPRDDKQDATCTCATKLCECLKHGLKPLPTPLACRCQAFPCLAEWTLSLQHVSEHGVNLGTVLQGRYQRLLRKILRLRPPPLRDISCLSPRRQASLSGLLPRDTARCLVFFQFRRLGDDQAHVASSLTAVVEGCPVPTVAHLSLIVVGKRVTRNKLVREEVATAYNVAGRDHTSDLHSQAQRMKETKHATRSICDAVTPCIVVLFIIGSRFCTPSLSRPPNPPKTQRWSREKRKTGMSHVADTL